METFNAVTVFLLMYFGILWLILVVIPAYFIGILSFIPHF